ncbi:MAG: hypothetical protein PUG37_02435, partial [Bacillales bacterium]|nr:hypothetical protein [Bacillales bacterium]
LSSAGTYAAHNKANAPIPATKFKTKIISPSTFGLFCTLSTYAEYLSFKLKGMSHITKRMLINKNIPITIVDLILLFAILFFKERR